MCLEYIHFMLMNNANFQCNHGINMEKQCKLVEMFVFGQSDVQPNDKTSDRQSNCNGPFRNCHSLSFYNSTWSILIQ